jgi:hypothetical protein
VFHDPLHDARVAADVEDIRRRHLASRGPVSERPRRGPGRFRRSTATVLLRTAERLAQQPISVLVTQRFSDPSAGSARRPAAG